ncbi:MAG: hypothetical protein H0X45_02030 [Planctomycetes bacterium]|nr:hypothetical protein [Planctomycetota bacterium]
MHPCLRPLLVLLLLLPQWTLGLTAEQESFASDEVEADEPVDQGEGASADGADAAGGDAGESGEAGPGTADAGAHDGPSEDGGPGDDDEHVCALSQPEDCCGGDDGGEGDGSPDDGHAALMAERVPIRQKGPADCGATAAANAARGDFDFRNKLIVELRRGDPLYGTKHGCDFYELYEAVCMVGDGDWNFVQLDHEQLRHLVRTTGVPVVVLRNLTKDDRTWQHYVTVTSVNDDGSYQFDDPGRSGWTPGGKSGDLADIEYPGGRFLALYKQPWYGFRFPTTVNGVSDWINFDCGGESGGTPYDTRERRFLPCTFAVESVGSFTLYAHRPGCVPYKRTFEVTRDHLWKTTAIDAVDLATEQEEAEEPEPEDGNG